jgi:C-terminal processing protease CtpA/Prc
MKTLRTACLIGFLPALALAQTVPPPDAPPAPPPPFEPVLAQNHQGPGRIGVRLEFDKATGIPMIVALIRSGPAEDFGFKVGDKIIKIDKNFTNTLTEDQVSLALHGEAGSSVELTIQRNDDPHLIIRSLSRRTLPAGSQEMVNPPMNEVIHPPSTYTWM